MRFVYEQLDIRSANAIREQTPANGVAGIDADSDSDPESGGRINGRPNRPLEPTRMNWPAHRERSCAGGSTPPR